MSNSFAKRVSRDIQNLFSQDFKSLAGRTSVVVSEPPDNELYASHSHSIREASYSVRLNICVHEGPYAGGHFIFYMIISKTYPFGGVELWVDLSRPLWHPNVDLQSGRVLLPLSWSPVLTLTNIAMAIQMMLLEPSADNPLNLEACAYYSSDPSQFEHCVQRTLNGGNMSGDLQFLRMRNIACECCGHGIRGGTKAASAAAAGGGRKGTMSMSPGDTEDMSEGRRGNGSSSGTITGLSGTHQRTLKRGVSDSSVVYAGDRIPSESLTDNHRCSNTSRINSYSFVVHDSSINSSSISSDAIYFTGEMGTGKRKNLGLSSRKNHLEHDQNNDNDSRMSHLSDEFEDILEVPVPAIRRRTDTTENTENRETVGFDGNDISKIKRNLSNVNNIGGSVSLGSEADKVGMFDVYSHAKKSRLDSDSRYENQFMQQQQQQADFSMKQFSFRSMAFDAIATSNTNPLIMSGLGGTDCRNTGENAVKQVQEKEIDSYGLSCYPHSHQHGAQQVQHTQDRLSPEWNGFT